MSLIYPSLNAKFLLYFHKIPSLVSQKSNIIEDDLYCKINIIVNSYICVKFYASDHSVYLNSSMLQVVFTSTNAESMIKLISIHLLISSNLSISHALYIGGELMKAELALIMRQEYIQN